MKKRLIQTGFLAIGLFLGVQQISAQDIVDKVDTSIYPKAEKGMVQYLIEVPHSTIEEDSNKKIEISVGKYMSTDTCNTQFLSGEFVEKDVKGYGYNYLEFKTNGQVGSTLIGCLDTKSITKFVTAQPKLTNYNGRLPIVVYVPEGYEVQFKIFKAEPETYRAYQINPKK